MSKQPATGAVPRPSSMPPEAFLEAFGGVYEHSSWIAKGVLDGGLDARADTPDGLAALMAEALAAAPESRKLALLRAHPDLAGKLALAGETTASSRNEQASAGLDRCSPQELARFQSLNDEYTGKFGFPFIIAVRGLDRAGILEAFERRVGNPRDVELAEALRQVNKIAHLRLVEWFAGG